MTNTSQPLVLASTSQSRQALLRRLQLPFTTYANTVDETPYTDESVANLVQRLSFAKAQAASTAYPKAWIIGSDQSAMVDGVFLKKPGSIENASKQLSLCSGKEVVFHAGVCLLNACNGNHSSDIVQTTVRFRQLSQDEIERYVRTERPLNSAGSFYSEALGIGLFESIHSDDPTALLGLPLIRLCHRLRAAGYLIP